MLIKMAFPILKTLNKLLDIFLKICDAMNYAHSKGILHLDLKPENIQVGTHGEVIICDWGLAKVLHEKDSENNDIDNLLLNPDLLNNLTLQGKIKGTPGFMAPEQIDQKIKKSAQTDIYALGGILYTILTNKLTVSSKNTEEILIEIIEGQIAPPDENIKRFIPETLLSISYKALSIKPEDRYGSVLEMQEDVRRYMTGYSAVSEDFSFLKELKLFYRRNQIVCNIAIILALVIVISTATIIRQLQGKLLAEEKARIEQQKRVESDKEKLLAEEKARNEEKRRLETEKETWYQYYQKAIESLSAGDYKAVLENAAVAAHNSGEISEPLNLIALVHFLQGNYQQANDFFKQPLPPLFDSLRNLNSFYLSGSKSTEEETKLTKDLIGLCKLTEPSPITTSLFIHWLKSENIEYRQFAANSLNLKIDDAERLLLVAKNLPYEYIKHEIASKVTKVLIYNVRNQEWLNRRNTLELAISLVKLENEKKILREMLPKNLAEWQHVKAIGMNSKNPEKAVDGDPDSCWSATPCPASLEVDFGISRLFDNTKIVFRQDAKSTILYYYTIEISDDGQNYKLIVDKSDNRRKHTIHSDSFEQVSARFVRLNVIKSSVNLGAHVIEFQVFNSSAN